MLRDCNIPEDPNWPAPINGEEVRKLMNRLPHWAQVVCAVTAAEMVLPIWEDWAEDRDDLTNQQKEAPGRAIDAAKQRLDEEIDIPLAARVARAAADAAWDAARAAYTAVWVAYAAGAARAAAEAAAAAADAARAARADAAEAATDAAEAAAYVAARVAGAARDDFYLDWWRVCRCRLSFILEARPF